MKKNINDQFLTLTRVELAFLARQYETPILVGYPRETLSLQEKRVELIEKSLLEKGLIKQPDGKLVLITQPDTLRTLFNPERALVVVRNQTNLGIQRSIICARKDHFILHVQPNESTFMVREIPADSIYPAILDWLKFDFERFPSGLTLSMSETAFEEFRIRVEKGGVGAITTEQGEPEGIKQLAEAIHTRVFSASVANVKIHKDEAENVLTFSLLVGQESTWAFTAQSNVPGYLRIETIGKEFPSFLRGIIGLIAEDALSTVQSFVLSEETLGYCLASINRADLGVKLLTGKYGQVTEEKVKEIFTKARDVLIRANLCTVSGNDQSKLDEKLERAIFPLAMCDSVVRAEIISPDLQKHANIYTQKGKHFTSTIRSNDKIYLEHDKSSELSKYLFNIYADFGKSSQPVVKGTEKIHLSTLQELTSSGNDKNKVIELLKKAALPESIRSIFEEDLQNQVYRGLIQWIDAGSTGVDKSTPQRARKTLLLMQSPGRSWVFEFLDTKNDPTGSMRVVSRSEFLETLKGFLA